MAILERRTPRFHEHPFSVLRNSADLQPADEYQVNWLDTEEHLVPRALVGLEARPAVVFHHLGVE